MSASACVRDGEPHEMLRGAWMVVDGRVWL